jgi:hypothetical protein
VRASEAPQRPLRLRSASGGASRCADELAVPAATFERLVKLCLDNKRGEYYVKVADEKVNYVSDEKTWMVSGIW